MTWHPLTGFVVIALATWATSLSASTTDAVRGDPGLKCDYAAAKAAETTGVPIDILLAITRVETGRGGLEPAPWPWTINADGQGDWYDTKDAAVAAATAHLTDGTGTFDVGCFQLNIRWHGDHFDTLSDMFDPTQNAEYAAAFLMQLYQESGDWSKAVSAYHSRTPDLADLYLQKVKAVLAGPGSPASPTGDYADEPVVRENLFPLLQAGGQGSVGSLVPLQSARGPLIGGNS
jgi:hypothetical protein